MILKVHDDLRTAVLRTKPFVQEQRVPSYVMVMTGTGLQKLRVENKSHKIIEAEQQELSFIVELVPEWMKETLAEGSVLVMTQEEWSNIPTEVIDYIEILSY